MNDSPLRSEARMESAFLVLSTFCFLFSFGAAAFGLGARQFETGRWSAAGMLAGFAFQTGFLYLRGQADGSCPINSFFEVLIFISWSTALIYLIIGPAYRLSLMGAFTASLVFVLQLLALVLPIDSSPRPRAVLDPWLELHAALSLMAYGAFALAGIAGLMYLLQERQLKSRRPGNLSNQLPAISALSAANVRLLWLGFLLLAGGIAAGFAVRIDINLMKLSMSFVILALYAAVLLWKRFWGLAAGRVAKWSIASFVFTLLALPAIQWLSMHA